MSRQKTLLGGVLPTPEEKKVMDRYAERMTFALTAPMIVHPVWRSIITDKQKTKAMMYRLAKVKGEDDEQATDYEAMLWLSTASLDAPLDRDAFNIYAYVFRKFYTEQANEIFSEHEGRHLDQHMEAPLLIRLKRDIYKSQKKALKKRADKVKVNA